MVAQVKDGYLQGQHLAEGAQGSMRLEGRIQPDGRATLEAKGTTGDPKFLMKGGRPGTAYAYTVQARFEGSRGMGRRVQLRACTLNFARQ